MPTAPVRMRSKVDDEDAYLGALGFGAGKKMLKTRRERMGDLEERVRGGGWC